MRKPISALIFGLSLLTITSAFSFLTATYRVTTIPSSGGHLLIQATSSAMPTSAFTPQPSETPVRGHPPLSLTLILLALCCAFLLLIGMLILGFVVRNQSLKEWKKDQQSGPD